MSSEDTATTTPLERMDAVWHAHRAKTLGLGDAVYELAKLARITHRGAQIMLSDHRPPSVQYATTTAVRDVV